MSEWQLKDEVLRLLTELDQGCDVGFLAATLKFDQSIVREAVETLVLDGAVVSAPARSSGGVTRLYKKKEK